MSASKSFGFLKNRQDSSESCRFEDASVKLKSQEARMRDFCNQTGRRVDKARTQVYASESGAGFGRSVSGKAVAANKKALTETAGRGIVNTGRISGALNPSSERAQKHAEQYYDAVRKMTTDVTRISKNTGFTEREIASVKDFVFLQEHDLGGPVPERFYPSYSMAQSWQRLIGGKNIQPHDLTLLRHELMEQDLMLQGLSQSEAHKIAEKNFNYGLEAKAYYAKTD